MIGLQTDMFAMLGEKVETRDEKMFRQALQIGSGFKGGKERIREIIRENERDFGKICRLIQKEYGTGGHSLEGGFVDYSPAGFQISDWTVRWDDPKNGMWNQHKTTTYTWGDVARKIIELIVMDEY